MLEAEFDQFAAEYRDQHAASIRLSGETPDYFAKYKIEDIARLLSRSCRTPEKILDFGGGVGNSLPYMSEAFLDSSIVLLDPSKESLGIAQARFPGKAEFQHYDGKAIPFEKNSFDLIFAACVFHHIPAHLHIGLLREIERVLAPGGSLFLYEHNPLNPLTLHAVSNCPFDTNAVLVRAREMRKRIVAAGFKKAEVTYRFFFPRPLAVFRVFERFLTRVPLGAQYYVHAVKPDA